MEFADITKKVTYWYVSQSEVSRFQLDTLFLNTNSVECAYMFGLIKPITEKEALSSARWGSCHVVYNPAENSWNFLKTNFDSSG